MKLIVALLRPEKLEAVEAALDEPGVRLTSVSQVVDVRDPCPRQRYRGLEVRVPRPKLRLEIVVVNETLVEWAVKTIARAGSADDPERLGCGDILLMPLDDCLRIPAADQLDRQSDREVHDETLLPIHLGRYRC